MPEMNVEDFKFPDEKQESQEQEEQFEVEVEDDTPTEDRRREPMPKPLVEELEQDELDQYDDGVKQKLKQMRKVWHDERREKEVMKIGADIAKQLSSQAHQKEMQKPKKGNE